MPQTLQKLSPHRDLQCYFLLPSAIAAMSQGDGVRRLRLHFLTVERYTGAISGLDEILRQPT